MSIPFVAALLLLWPWTDGTLSPSKAATPFASVPEPNLVVATDQEGSIFLAGTAPSSGRSSSLDSIPFERPESSSTDIFVAKLDPVTQEPLFTTWIGGTGSEAIADIEIGKGGEIFLAGTTSSSDFPTTHKAHDRQFNGGTDGFLVKLDRFGSSLLYSTYLGGSGEDRVEGLSVGPNESAFLVGSTDSGDFPGVFKRDTGLDAFAIRLETADSGLHFATLLTGSGRFKDRAVDVALDGSGNVWVLGQTEAPDFPSTPDAFSGEFSGGTDAFLCRMDSSSGALLDSTYLGGSGDELASQIKVDRQGRVAVSGSTSSLDFPIQGSVLGQRHKGGTFDFFLSILDARLSRLKVSGYIGGEGNEGFSGRGAAIDLDKRGIISLTGSSDSPDFPVTSDADAASLSSPGRPDPVLVRFKTSGELLYASYLSGANSDFGLSIAVDPRGSAVVAGLTSSDDFSSIQPASRVFGEGSMKAFVTGFSDPVGAAVILARKSVHLQNNLIIDSGDIVVNQASEGPFLDSEASLSISNGVTTAAGFQLKADRIKIKNNAEIGGHLFFNHLENDGDVTGSLNSPLPLPVVESFPSFQGGTPGIEDVILQAKQTLTLSAGRYGQVNLGPGATLVLSGGTYELHSFVAASDSRILFDTQTRVLIGGTLETGSTVFLGPAEGSELEASDIVFFVAGITETKVSQEAFPKTVLIGVKNRIVANFYAAAGTIWIREQTSATGAFLADDVLVGNGAQLNLDSAFANAPPTAAADGTTTSEDTPVDFDVLENDHDPDGDPLFISSFQQPAHGTLTLSSSNRFRYSPELNFNGEDRFTYEISDGREGSSEAEVTLIVTAVNDPPEATLSADTLEGDLPLRVAFTADARDPDGDPLVFDWSFGDGTSRENGSSGEVHEFTVAGEFTVSVTVNDGLESLAQTLVIVVTNPLPPDPSLIARPLNRSTATSLSDAVEFLFTGEDPIQTGVVPETIDPRRVAVLRGRVLDSLSRPLSGAVVTIAGRPEFGQTLSRIDGWLDLVVNGGGPLTVNYEKPGFLSAQRVVEVPWADYLILPEVVLVERNPVASVIDLEAADTPQMAEGSPVFDGDGSRQARILFPEGTRAEMVLADGTVQPLTRLTVRITEFTVGPNGPQAMPARLPAQSAYTYAAEFGVDEADAAEAVKVRFDEPVISYVENFLDFPVGIDVPAASYDRLRNQWIPSQSGRIIQIIGVAESLAQLDIDGSGQAADLLELTQLGISEAERETLARLYQPGQSLWRVPIPHFSPWDFNWTFFTPADAVFPRLRLLLDQLLDDPCELRGSIIECQNQVLGERIGVTGTGISLNYRSDRVSGRTAENRIEIPLTEENIPGSLQGIELEIELAGRSFKESFPAQANLQTTFHWDGRDAYGRLLQGRQPVKVRIGYVYEATYQTTPRFSLSGGRELTGNTTRQQVTLWRQKHALIGPWDARALGLGGWTLDLHHSYDPVAKTLYLGDGRRRRADNLPPVIESLSALGFVLPRDVEVAPDGSVFVADTCAVKKITTDGNVVRVAGTGNCFSPSLEAAPATQSGISPRDIKLAPDGGFYLTDLNRIRRVGADGIINTVAGNGSPGLSGEGTPAVQAQLNQPNGLALDSDGTLYFAEFNNHLVRRISPDGLLFTVAGTGVNGSGGDGGPARMAQLRGPIDLDLGPDSSLYIADSQAGLIRRVDTAGTITRVAGTGGFGPVEEGIPATEARISFPSGITVGPDGSLFISSTDQDRIRVVSPDGIISTFAGTGTGGNLGDGGPAARAQLSNPANSRLAPDGSLYVTVTGKIRHISSPFPGLSLSNLLIASEDGTQVFQFDPDGRHLQTLNSLNGTVLFEFFYDVNGLLDRIEDTDANTIVIERDAAGNPAAFHSPLGQRSTFTLDSNGLLKSITNPAGESLQMAYSADGLLTSLTEPRGNSTRFEYDPLGRFLRETDAAGGFQALHRTELENGFQITHSTAEGRVQTHRVERLAGGEQLRETMFPDGTESRLVRRADESRLLQMPDGTEVTTELGPDPRFGMQAPLLAKHTITTPSGLKSVIVAERTANLSVVGNPLSAAGLTDKVNVNGRIFSRIFDLANSQSITTSAEGRQSFKTIDNQGRVVTTQVAGLEPLHFEHDNLGRLARVLQGSGTNQRTTVFSYNDQGQLATVKDSLDQITAFEFDSVGRVSLQTLPDGQQVLFDYDANGNLSKILPPGRPSHTFAYNEVNQEAVYTAPAVGSGLNQTRFLYDLDRQLRQILRPDGETVVFDYDTAGRIASISLREGKIQFGYDSKSGNLVSLNSPDGSGLSFSYDGSLPTEEHWSGEISGRVQRVYDNNFRVVSRSVNDTQRIDFLYDQDNLLVNAGDLFIQRNPLNGLISETSLGNVSDNWSFNGFAELSSYQATSADRQLYSAQLVRDNLGRIIEKIETVDGATSKLNFSYDKVGRLEEFWTNDVLISSYSYDPNGNRFDSLGTSPAVYDDQDRLLKFGETTYAYTQNGELLSKSTAGKTTTYRYDSLGNLLSVDLPEAKAIEYAVDAANRRIGKRVNGTIVQAFLYLDDLNPIAELDGSGNLISRFVYATRFNVPDFMIRNGRTYRLLSDHLGSVRLVVDVESGAIVQRLDYDDSGEVLSDTNPGFQPFGFAGGLYDIDTGLVHFGSREYDPETGRWTSKDPLRFGAGDLNLYVYSRNDPINLIDPTGQAAIDWIQLGLDLGGLLPVVGEPLDILNAGISFARGDCVSASLSLAASIPVAGAFATAAKFGIRLRPGIKVFRVWGDGARAWGKSWTTVDPRAVQNYRNVAGLPNQNTARFVSEGILNDIRGVVVKEADELDGNAGGLIELVIPNPEGQVVLTRASGVNPEF